MERGAAIGIVSPISPQWTFPTNMDSTNMGSTLMENSIKGKGPQSRAKKKRTKDRRHHLRSNLQNHQSFFSSNLQIFSSLLVFAAGFVPPPNTPLLLNFVPKFTKTKQLGAKPQPKLSGIPAPGPQSLERHTGDEPRRTHQGPDLTSLTMICHPACLASTWTCPRFSVTSPAAVAAASPAGLGSAVAPVL